MATQKDHFNLSDIDTVYREMVEHAVMAHGVVEVKSFPLELAMIAAVLHEQNMPQESINKVLAVRCGLPMQAVDHRSPYFVWAEDVPGELEASHAQNDEGVTPGEFIDAVRDDLFRHTASDKLEVCFMLKINPISSVPLCESEQTVRIPLMLQRKWSSSQQES